MRLKEIYLLQGIFNQKCLYTTIYVDIKIEKENAQFMLLLK